MLSLELGFITHCYITSFLALFLNGILLYAVYRRTPAELQSYKIVILNIVISDFLVAFGMLFLQPVPASSTKEVERPANDSGISYVIMGPVVYFIHPHYNHMLTCIFVGVVLYAMLTVPISFLYRYIHVCKQKISPLVSSTVVRLLLFSILVFDSLTAAVLMYTGDMPKQGAAALVSSWSEYYTHLDDDPNVPKFGNLIHLDYHVYYAVALLFFNFIMAYVLLGATAALIVRKLHRMQELQAMSIRTIKLQKRLTYCLSCQSALPVIFGGTPICLIAITISAGMYTQFVSSLAMAIYSYQQIFGPATTMAFMPSYRYGSRRWKATSAKISTNSRDTPSRAKCVQPGLRKTSKFAETVHVACIEPKPRANSAHP